MVDLGMVGGRRVRRQFRTESGAVEFGARAGRERREAGELGLGLSVRDRAEAAEARALLGGVSLVEAARFWLDGHARPALPCVSALVPVFVSEREAAGRRGATIHELRYRLRVLCRSFGDVCVDAVGGGDLARWLGQWPGLVNRENYRRVAHGFFG